ncbi:hypothetical protein [Lactococcus lactis]|uniref:hypothetical protein n=1 Tax=Lactococcus lactis TaxID=1358 RepID=UPI00223B1D4C|nr:hypothetical protein [Lactococcus lactis]MCT0449084.1 hypothetical protein [Lactococcus lactis subsp. lactis]
MFNYILADTLRIFRKKSFLIVFLGYMILFLIMIFIYFNTSFSAENYIEKTKNFLGYFPFITGLAVFLSVYYDDFKSKAMQTAIGRGLPRYKVVLCKFLESLLLLFFSVICMFVLNFSLPIILGIPLNHTQIVKLLLITSTEFLRSIGYVAISAIPIFYMQNALIGTIFYVLLSSKTIFIFLTLILGQEIFVHTLGNLTSYLFTSELYRMTDEFVKNRAIDFSLIWVILLYILLPMLLSTLSFSKKELEF